MPIAFPLPCGIKQLILWQNIRAHPRGECAPMSCIIVDIFLCDRGDFNGVPSLCVTINMYIHALRVGLSVGTGSLPKAVAVDEVDIFIFFLSYS